MNSKTKSALAKAKAAYNARLAQGADKTNKRTTGKPSAKKQASEKPVKAQPEAESVAMGKYIAIGSRGTAFLLTLPTALEIGERVAPMEKLHLPGDMTPHDIGELHAQGKACGVVWVDSISWIAPRGEKYLVLTLRDAIKQGAVKQVKATIARDGQKARTVKAYVSAKLNLKAHKYPHCIATSEVKAGRIETRLVNDKRNESLVYKVKLA